MNYLKMFDHWLMPAVCFDGLFVFSDAVGQAAVWRQLQGRVSWGVKADEGSRAALIDTVI